MTVTPIGRGLYRVSDGTREWTVAVAGPPDNRWVWIEGQVAKLDAPAARVRRGGRSGAGDLTAPMPATVISVKVAVGDTVAKGETLLMLEAMKMELAIRAPQDGVVKAINCREGELVQPAVPLVTVE